MVQVVLGVAGGAGCSRWCWVWLVVLGVAGGVGGAGGAGGAGGVGGAGGAGGAGCAGRGWSPVDFDLQTEGKQWRFNTGRFRKTGMWDKPKK